MGNNSSQPSTAANAHSHSHSHSHSHQSHRSSTSSNPHSLPTGAQPTPQAQPARPQYHTQRATSSTPSDAGSYDYTLTPATSLSPSVTRVEAHHHTHRHGSSLDSYLVEQPAAADAAMGAASSSEKLPKPRPQNRDRNDSGGPRTTPVSVPTRQKSLRQRETTPQPETPPFRPSGPPRDNEPAASYGPAPPVFHHPPRLPLPIEQEELTPGSPVLTARDFHGSVPGIEGDDELGLDGVKSSKSLLSHGTADEEEESVGDPAELDQQAVDAKRRTRPVEVTWVEPGEKVYVTGTFANWSKKYRMHRDPKTGHAKTTLELLPGMHHIRYIVDGDMRLREDNDQAVDYTNTLVNIIEVPAEPVFQTRPDTQGPSTGNDGDGTTQTETHPPQDMPSGVSNMDHEPQAEPRTPQTEEDIKAAGPELMSLPPLHYGQQVPTYLLDLDRDERSARFQRASSRVADIPPPPSLPGFLSKSILNGTTPMKDDSSVLNMPNHTVLNHLATSSIRQGVLATSLTTRYKRKYVTLITYRPTSVDD